MEDMGCVEDGEITKVLASQYSNFLSDRVSQVCIARVLCSFFIPSHLLLFSVCPHISSS